MCETGSEPLTCGAMRRLWIFLSSQNEKHSRVSLMWIIASFASRFQRLLDVLLIACELCFYVSTMYFHGAFPVFLYFEMQCNANGYGWWEARDENQLMAHLLRAHVFTVMALLTKGLISWRQTGHPGKHFRLIDHQEHDISLPVVLSSFTTYMEPNIIVRVSIVKWSDQ